MRPRLRLDCQVQSAGYSSHGSRADDRAGAADPSAHRGCGSAGGVREGRGGGQPGRSRRPGPASRSQLYHYFVDKADLLRAVAEATNDTVLDGQQDLFAGLGSWDGTGAMGRRDRGVAGGAGRQRRLSHRQPPRPAGRRRTTRSASWWPLASTGGRPRSGPAWLPWPARESCGPTLTSTGSLPSTLASLQGGLVLSQARRDPRALRRALDGALALIGDYRSSHSIGSGRSTINHGPDVVTAGLAPPRRVRVPVASSPRRPEPSCAPTGATAVETESMDHVAPSRISANSSRLATACPCPGGSGPDRRQLGGCDGTTRLEGRRHRRR